MRWSLFSSLFALSPSPLAPTPPHTAGWCALGHTHFVTLKNLDISSIPQMLGVGPRHCVILSSPGDDGVWSKFWKTRCCKDFITLVLDYILAMGSSGSPGTCWVRLGVKCFVLPKGLICFLFWVSGTFLTSVLPSPLPSSCLVPKPIHWKPSCGGRVLD